MKNKIITQIFSVASFIADIIYTALFIIAMTQPYVETSITWVYWFSFISFLIKCVMLFIYVTKPDIHERSHYIIPAIYGITFVTSLVGVINTFSSMFVNTNLLSAYIFSCVPNTLKIILVFFVFKSAINGLKSKKAIKIAFIYEVVYTSYILISSIANVILLVSNVGESHVSEAMLMNSIASLFSCIASLLFAIALFAFSVKNTIPKADLSSLPMFLQKILKEKEISVTYEE